MKLILLIPSFFLLLSLGSCLQGNSETTQQEQSSQSALPLEKIQLPAGFKIALYAENIDNARSMDLSPNGTLFVGNRKSDKVYALQDNNHDFKADKVVVLASGLNMPNGVAFRNGDLYVAEVNRILRFKDIENHLDAPTFEVIYDQLPTDRWHGWKYINFGPDGKLYVPVGAPCNVCDKEAENEIYATIARMNPDGSNLEVFARGIRNSVGFDWHPDTGELWFTDNGRDYLGDDEPPCELNRAEKKGQHFGFPFCHAGEIADPEFGEKRACDEFTPPAQKLGAHVAPLGMEFYTGTMFPASYQKQIIFAEHGSWNRTAKVGYKLSFARLEGNKVVAYETFASGWLQGENAWGRPVDVELLSDGSMLVSDDFANCIYRIYYEG